MNILTESEDITVEQKRIRAQNSYNNFCQRISKQISMKMKDPCSCKRETRLEDGFSGRQEGNNE